METELLNWKEKLDLLNKGKSLELPDDLNTQTIYSAIRDNSELFKGRKFSIRTHPGTLKKRVLRIK